MASATLTYVSAGCNRSVHAAAWNAERGPGGGLLAYGSHSSIALYDPATARVVRTVGKAHDGGQVTAVSWLDGAGDESGCGRWMASGGSDGAVLLWRRVDDPATSTRHEWVVVAAGSHGAPVTDVCALAMSGGGGHPGDANEGVEGAEKKAGSRGVYLLATASQDCTVRMWRVDLTSLAPRRPASPRDGRTDTAGDIAIPMNDGSDAAARFVGSMSTPGKATPMSAALAWLPGDGPARVVAAVGCADGHVRVHLCAIPLLEGSESASSMASMEHAATLEGHTDWVRDLAFVEDGVGTNREVRGSSSSGIEGVGGHEPGGLLLASASQDRTARVWRISRSRSIGDEDETSTDAPVHAFMRLAAPPKPKSALLGGDARLSTHLEALLQGHDDWVLSVAWRPRNPGGDKTGSSSRPELLTASMDRSLILWTPSASGAGDVGSLAGGSTVWMADVSVGEAAASCLGFYGASFSADGTAMLAHSHGGALHLWDTDGGREWIPRAACTGHVADVTCASWDSSGRWLLTGSQDMTCRLHSEWRGGGNVRGWRQLARPQVHGHAIVCVAALPSINPGAEGGAECGSRVFVSGADEKTLRVFEAPGTFLGSLGESLGGNVALDSAALAAGIDAGAELPQLGLSNKALHAPGVEGDTPGESTKVTNLADSSGDGDDRIGSVTPSVLSRPPPEEVLAQATLWPETRKLYGHGNDLSVVAAHPSGTLVASACCAQSSSAAAVWMWASGSDWRPLGSLPGATLDVVALDFASKSNRDCLLAASRDRHVALYAPVDAHQERGVWGERGWSLVARVKASAKALYDAGWAPGDACVFACAGRDKKVRVWNVDHEVVGSNSQVAVAVAAELPLFDSAATASRFSPTNLGVDNELSVLAVGLECGRVSVWVGEGARWTCAVEVSRADAHVAAVRAIAWRPFNDAEDEDEDAGDEEVKAASASAASSAGGGGAGLGLATVGADHSVRLFRVTLR